MLRMVFPPNSIEKIEVDTVVFTLPVNSQGNVAMTDVATSYDNMKIMVKDVYDNIPYQDKHIVSLTLTEGEGNNFRAISTTGEKGTDPSVHFTHCWIYGENQGYCHDPDPFQWIMDGGDTLANELFANRPIPMYCPQGYHGIIVPDYSNSFTGNGALETGYIFYIQKPINNSFTDEEKELSDSEMNYWYDQEYNFLFTVLPEALNKPGNWVMTSLSIDGYEHFIGNSIHYINHKNIVEYGLFYCVPDNEIEPPEDL